MIEERLESLIEMYTIEIEDDTECLKKYKDELENANRFEERIFNRFKIYERRKLK